MKDDEYRLERKRMVDDQIVKRGILDPTLLTVMGMIPRHLFVPTDDLAWAYADGPLSIGQGQTISQPYIVALMTELLQLDGSDHVLEVGTGSGYQAAVLGKIVSEVHTVELIPELAAEATRILKYLGYPNVYVHLGDGSLGWPESAPYDAILVAAAAPSAPQPLLDQLAEGGRLVVPVGGSGFQHLEVWERKGQDFNCQANLAVAFVLLRGEFGWK